MPAVEIPIIEPVTSALQTDAGWIGLLLGLGGRETARNIRRLWAAIRGGGDDT